MAPQCRDLIQQLSSETKEAKLRAVRFLKNEIIGSQYKKQCYLELGAVPKIVQILASQQDKKCTVQAAATLGSFAYGNDAGAAAVVDRYATLDAEILMSDLKWRHCTFVEDLVQ